MLFAETIIENENIVWSRGNIVTFFGMILQRCCLHNNIPSLKARAACIDGRIEIMDETKNGSLRGWEFCYKEYTDNPESIDSAVINTATAWLKNFKKKPNRPRYSEINSVLNFNYKKFVNEITSRIRIRLTRQYWYEQFNYKIDKEMNIRPKFGSFMLEDFVNREVKAVILRQQKWYKDERISLNKDFIYLPLQYSPEISTLMHGVMYEKQEIFVDHLSKIIPSKYKILIKEHTSMVGRRDLSFYKKLDKYFNVKLVSPKISTFSLIKECSGVATITSTAGWEAFLFGKPVITVGEVFYQDFPGVLKLVPSKTSENDVYNYLNDFKADYESILNSVICYFNTTYECTTGDIGIDVDESQADKNAHKIAKAYRHQLENYPLESLISI